MRKARACGEEVEGLVGTESIVCAMQEDAEERFEILPSPQPQNIAAQRKKFIALDALDEAALESVEGAITSLYGTAAEEGVEMQIIHSKLHLLTKEQRGIVLCLLEGIPDGVIMYALGFSSNRTYRRTVRSALTALKAAVNRPN